MWIASKQGFLSIVENRNSKTEDDELLVRARVRADLVDLINFIIDRNHTAPFIACTPEADYQFRTVVSRRELSAYLAQLVKEIDYPNFKNEVAKSDPERAVTYGGVWAVLNNLARAAS
jgi:hypothetical protein